MIVPATKIQSLNKKSFATQAADDAESRKKTFDPQIAQMTADFKKDECSQ
jgi:hypothetical protein